MKAVSAASSVHGSHVPWYLAFWGRPKCPCVCTYMYVPVCLSVCVFVYAYTLPQPVCLYMCLCVSLSLCVSCLTPLPGPLLLYPTDQDHPSTEGVNVVQFLTLNNTSPAVLVIRSLSIDGYSCEAYGYEISQCRQEVVIAANESKKVEIR